MRHEDNSERAVKNDHIAPPDDEVFVQISNMNAGKFGLLKVSQLHDPIGQVDENTSEPDGVDHCMLVCVRMAVDVVFFI